LHPKKTRILLVNDDKRICEIVKIILETRGYEVDVACKSDEAIQKSKSNVYNLAALDTGSDVESRELLSALQEISPKMIKIIGTHTARPEDFITVFGDCADGYYAKPVEAGHVVNLIEEKLEDQNNPKTTKGKR
jgi:DNA-binding NtrC family response regulator